MQTIVKSGLSPQLIMRASLARHLKEIKVDANAPHWQTVEGQKRSAESEIESLGYASDYAEPGYTAGERGILTADWNPFHSGITDLLEKAGFSCEWSDEWSTCDNCGKLVRTSPDCYGWQPSYMMGDGEITCLKCVDWAEHLESIEDDASKAVTADCNPAEYGYQRLSEPKEYENGFHPGQNDSPHAILKRLQEAGKSGIVFRVPEVGQFDVKFETWERVQED